MCVRPNWLAASPSEADNCGENNFSSHDRMAVLGVVPGKECLAMDSGFFDAAKALRGWESRSH
jgi:hypothetical protein